METVNEAIEKRKPIRSFADKKVEAEDAYLDAVDRFDASWIHYNTY